MTPRKPVWYSQRVLLPLGLKSKELAGANEISERVARDDLLKRWPNTTILGRGKKYDIDVEGRVPVDVKGAFIAVPQRGKNKGTNRTKFHVGTHGKDKVKDCPYIFVAIDRYSIFYRIHIVPGSEVRRLSALIEEREKQKGSKTENWPLDIWEKDLDPRFLNNWSLIDNELEKQLTLARPEDTTRCRTPLSGGRRSGDRPDLPA